MVQQLIQDTVDSWNRIISDLNSDPSLKVKFLHGSAPAHPGQRLTDYVYKAGIYYEESNAPLIMQSFQFNQSKPAEDCWLLVYTELLKLIGRTGISSQLEFQQRLNEQKKVI